MKECTGNAKVLLLYFRNSTLDQFAATIKAHGEDFKQRLKKGQFTPKFLFHPPPTTVGTKAGHIFEPSGTLIRGNPMRPSTGGKQVKKKYEWPREGSEEEHRIKFSSGRQQCPGSNSPSSSCSNIPPCSRQRHGLALTEQDIAGHTTKTYTVMGLRSKSGLGNTTNVSWLVLTWTPADQTSFRYQSLQTRALLTSAKHSCWGSRITNCSSKNPIEGWKKKKQRKNLAKAWAFTSTTESRSS